MNTVVRKSLYKNFFPWQFEEEQNWLQEMARQGWRLVKVDTLYYFIAAEPEEVVYRLDYVVIYGKKMARFRQLFIDAGWEFVCANWSGFQYFRIPLAQFSTDIYSDLPSRVEQLKRLRNSAITLVAAWIALMAPMIDNENGAMTQLIVVSYLLVAGMYLVWANKATQKIKALEQQLEEGNEEG